MVGDAGGRIRNGEMFRSGHLAGATPEDVDKLTELGIDTIIDFRTEVDRHGDGGADRLPPTATLVELPMTDTAGRGAEIRETLLSGDQALIDERYGNGRARTIAVAGAVAQALDPEKQVVYARFLRHLTSRRGPVLFHCSAGKDRAGWAATLVGMALGVSDQQLIEHYILSNTHRPPDDRLAHFSELGVDATPLLPFLRVHEDYLSAAFAAIDDAWPSREAYLASALGLDRSDADGLRADLLE